jgi:hypothetical protein
MKWKQEISLEPYIKDLYPDIKEEQAVDYFIHDLTYTPQMFELYSSSEDRADKCIAKVQLLDFKGIIDNDPEGSS